MNNIKKIFVTGLFVSLVALGISSCRFDQQPPEGSTKTKKIAMNVVVSHVPFWADTKATWNTIDEVRTDVESSFGGPQSDEAQKQIQEIEALITQKVDGIIIAPASSTELVPVINRAVENGIPVVTYLVDAPDSKRIAYVGSEAEQASIKIGQTVAKEAENGAEAIIVYAKAGNEEQENRRKGFEQFAMQNNLKIVGTVTDEYSDTKGAEKIKPLLSKYPNVKYIFGCNSRSAAGTVSALKESGFDKGKVIVTGWDTDEDVLNHISSGWVKASAFQNSSFMTELSFSILDARLGKWLYPKNRQFEKAGVRPLPEKIIIPIQVITQANVKGYFPRK